jgi:hypothetical protein
MKTKLAVLATLSLFAITAFAEPDPWYLWQNKLDGETYCAQTSPGEGWEQNDGSFTNARCRRLQSQSALTGEESNLAAKHDTRESPSSMDRKNRMMKLMAVFVAARASR